MRFISILINVLWAFSINAQTKSSEVIPEPYDVEGKNGFYNIPDNFVVVVPQSFQLSKKNLGDWENAEQIAGRNFSIVSGTSKKTTNAIVIKKSTQIISNEEYKLKVGKSQILIEAGHENAVFYAFKTLHQLLTFSTIDKTSKMPLIEVYDKPRYGYRGLMIDPARHFLPVEDVKKFINVMSYYKFNRLHLHLTDDQGWRIEVKEYPKLVEVASKRAETIGDNKPHEGYYTREDLKELVEYAKTKFVEIIPEVDMPGHNQAALAAYPGLACFPDTSFQVRTIPGKSVDIMCAGKEKVFDFYEVVLKEISEIFSYPEVHIGGDEAPLTRWKACAHCQEVIEEQSLEGEEELMTHFFERIEEILMDYGKKPVFWYEDNVANYPEGGTVHLWKNNPKKELSDIRNSGLKMINSYNRNVYFDYPQWKGDGPFTRWMPVLPLEKVYDFKPSFDLTEEEDDFILGVEACLWGEYMPNMNKVFYMAYPRALAVSEMAWTRKKNKSWETFKNKLTDYHLPQLMRNGILYRPPVELYDDK